ncbi:MAG: prolipoprotein diacylglyceryl transferase [Ectothiorhodospira sp.]
MSSHPTHPFIDPVAIGIGPVAIHWYGLMYLLGFAAFWILGRLRTRQPWSPLTAQQLGDLLFYGVLAVILGGRLGYVLFYQWEPLLQNPLMVLRIWEGGMSFHGGLLGVLLATGLYARRQGIGFFRLTDFVAPLVPIGLGLGRIGNWINGELWGKPTDLPWAMVFPAADHLPRHPSQLYQAFLEGLVLFTVLWLFTRHPRPTGAASGLFLIGYGLFRLVIEFVREPDGHLGYLAFGWLTMGQLLSLPMILAGVGLMTWAHRRGDLPKT